MRRAAEPQRTTLLGAVLSVALACTLGCASTTTTVREVGAPSTRVQDDLLPGPPELDAVVSRHEDTVRVELTRFRSCRRRELTVVQHERVEESRLGTGTAITGVSLAVVGLATSAVLVLAGGAVIGIGLLSTGTTVTPLPQTETVSPATRVPCNRTAAVGVVVQVLGAEGQYQGTTDERGVLELSEVEPGALRVQVDGEPVKVRTADAPRATKPAEPATPAEPPKRAEKRAPKPPRPRPAAPLPPEPTLPLPPPPPPPPGVRLFPD